MKDKQLECLVERIEGYARDTKEFAAHVTDQINRLSSDISNRMDALEKNVLRNSNNTAKIRKTQILQQEQLDELKKRVGKLSEGGSVIWRKGKRVALDRDDTYREIDGCALRRQQALRALRDAGILSTDSCGRFTIPVRGVKDGRLVRAIVVFTE